MGVKPSKFLKHSYVVSEGVQTDLSIQPLSDEDCREAMTSYKTPPRRVCHLSDPRSITRGIIRTPIMCDSYDCEEVVSPIPEKKPYLETDLDEVLLSYIPPDPCDHLVQVPFESLHPQPLPPHINDMRSDPVTVKKAESVCNDSGEHVNITIPPVVEDKDSSGDDVSLMRDSSLKSDILLSSESLTYLEGIDLFQTPVSDPLAKVIMTASQQNCPYQIDSSEAVEQVCQKILDELLNCDNDIRTDEGHDSGEELFPNREIDSEEEEVTQGLRGLTIIPATTPHSTVKEIPFLYGENTASPATSKFIKQTYNKADVDLLEQPLYTPSPSKRKPLGELNKNVQVGSGQKQSSSGRMSTIGVDASPLKSSSGRMSTIGMDASPLKAVLPLLHSHPTQQIKPHRSHWDTENTLII